jgi:hypothetical protein
MKYLLTILALLLLLNFRPFYHFIRSIAMNHSYTELLGFLTACTIGFIIILLVEKKK